MSSMTLILSNYFVKLCHSWPVCIFGFALVYVILP